MRIRLKLFLLSLTVSISFIAIAEHFEVPTGHYRFKSVSLYNLKHVLLLDQRSSRDREQIESLREKGYLCKSFPASRVQCQKYIKDFDGGLEIPEEELQSFIPNFQSKPIVSLITEADLLSTYEVEQTVETDLGNSNQYKLYVRSDGQKFLDVELGNKLHRYTYKTTDKLGKLLKKRERLNRKEHREYSFFLEFEKESQE